MTSAADREFDIVLLGATGYVGRLTAQHLARQAPAGLRIALAGRSPGRLSRVRGTLDPTARAWPLVTVNITDLDAVRALVARTRVLVSTVGPYLRHGLPLVEACAEAGTAYADLTGETLFARRSIDAAHERAQQTGARIVHACGFDSVPSDLGVALTAARAAADGQGQLGRTVLSVRSMRGGISGGTIDSLRQQMIEVANAPELRRVVSDPTCLVDEVEPSAVAAPAQSRAESRRLRVPVQRNPRDQRWHAPFVMGGFNRQIVLRSNAILGGAYGADFRYREIVDTGTGPAGVAAAGAIAAGSSALMVGMWLKPTRWLLDRVLPDPGEGPSDATRRRGRFLVEVESETTTGARYRTRIGADLDPGYGGTAVMLGESGISLAVDDLPERSGVLTPATAMGQRLADRLLANGFTVTTERVTD